MWFFKYNFPNIVFLKQVISSALEPVHTSGVTMAFDMLSRAFKPTDMSALKSLFSNMRKSNLQAYSLEHNMC